MREWNYEVYGVDISQYAARYAQESLNLNIHQGDLLSAHFPDKFFDVITMWDVLEQLINPLEIFTEIKRIIKKM
ncbi:hypothetical protein ES703_103415 [subsurface metagenome]